MIFFIYQGSFREVTGGTAIERSHALKQMDFLQSFLIFITAGACPIDIHGTHLNLSDQHYENKIVFLVSSNSSIVSEVEIRK